MGDAVAANIIIVACSDCGAVEQGSCHGLPVGTFHSSRIARFHERYPAKPTREPVSYRYDAILPDFLKRLAMIGHYADQKYGSWHQYLFGRLEGEKDPLNHIFEHYRQYVMGEPYDHFDGDARWHLAAIAYNAMMAFAYDSAYGRKLHPYAELLRKLGKPRDGSLGT